MTKDEIAKKWGLYMPSSNTRNAMQEYADQETERLKAELNELKERHKIDIMVAYGDGWRKGIDEPKFFEISLEQYYKQKFESND